MCRPRQCRSGTSSELIAVYDEIHLGLHTERNTCVNTTQLCEWTHCL